MKVQKKRDRENTDFAPVDSTERLPPCFLAVTSQAIREHVNAKGGVNVAAAQDWLSQISVRDAGITAPEMITPIYTYVR